MLRHATVVVAGLLAGCAHVAPHTSAPDGIGSASYRSAADSDLAHYHLAMGEIATGATPEVHAPPRYPPAMLASCPALVELPARVIVGADGRVGEVRIGAPTARQPYADAIRAAAQGWRYTPLTITRWAADAAGESHPVDSQTRPFSLDYVFSFRCAHGRATVSDGAGTAAR